MPNTIHTKVFDEYEIDNSIVGKFKDYFTLVYVGGFVSNRGLEHVIEGIAGLKEDIPNLRLVLVGDGDYKGILEQKVEECGVKEMVYFEGWMDQEKIKSYLIGCDIGLVPFKRTLQTDNSSSNKLFQYMYFELPILGTNCTSVKKLVENENCGLIYESENVEEFMKSTLKLFRDKDLIEELGKNGKKSVLSKFSWDVTTKDMIEMYSKLKS